MDHIGAILNEDPTPIDVIGDIQLLSQQEDSFPKLKSILSLIANTVSDLTCKKSLADGKYGKNRFHGIISFQNNRFLLQYVNESSIGFETLVRVYDYTYNKDQLFVTKFKNPKNFEDCIKEHEDIFRFKEMVRWRWDIKNVCNCCGASLRQQLTRLEDLATELDKMTARSRT
jgi:hypothetical protein